MRKILILIYKNAVCSKSIRLSIPLTILFLFNPTVVYIELSSQTTMPVIGNLLSSLFTIVADNKRCITNVLILVLTTVAHEIIDVTTFECPCISSIELKAGNSNYWYGVAYLVAPAIILFLVGISLSVDIWKWLTGCCTRFCRGCCDSENEKSCSRQHCTAALLFWTRVVAVALLAPAVWLSVSLLDGDAMACALTSSPYTFSESQTCADVSMNIKVKFWMLHHVEGDAPPGEEQEERKRARSQRWLNV